MVTQKQLAEIAELQKIDQNIKNNKILLQAAELFIADKLLDGDDIQDGPLKAIIEIVYNDITIGWKSEFENFVKDKTGYNWPDILGEIREKTFNSQKPTYNILIMPND